MSTKTIVFIMMAFLGISGQGRCQMLSIDSVQVWPQFPTSYHQTKIITTITLSTDGHKHFQSLSISHDTIEIFSCFTQSPHFNTHTYMTLSI